VKLVTELYAVSSALAGGGVAVTIHGATRSTKDIDILIAPNDVATALDLVRPLGACKSGRGAFVGRIAVGGEELRALCDLANHLHRRH
jgi:hypothetical protein